MNHYEAIEKSVLYIEDHLTHPLSLDSVSNTFHMSKYYYHRLFSAIMGCSLNQYILSRRLNAAVGLIQNEKLSLTDIAYELNFGTPSSFTRAFKAKYGISPSTLKKQKDTLSQEAIPPVIRRAVKHINGDIVTDFTLLPFETISLTGVAFEVDLADKNFKATIHSHSRRLVDSIDTEISGPCYIIYSNCQPNSTKFKALIGVPQTLEVHEPDYFNVTVQQFFSAKFKYSGDLLDIGDVFITDFARFLQISKQETKESDIELIQMFDDIHNLTSEYHIFTPIKRLSSDVITN